MLTETVKTWKSFWESFCPSCVYGFVTYVGSNYFNELFLGHLCRSFIEIFFPARRTMELLTQNWNLSKRLRIPAISRTQKMHNVDIVLQVLKSRGVQLTDEHGESEQEKNSVSLLNLKVRTHCANGLPFSRRKYHLV